MQTINQRARAPLIYLMNFTRRIFHAFPFLEKLLRGVAIRSPELIGVYLRLTSTPRRKPVLTAKATEIFDDLKAVTARPERKARFSLCRGRSL